MGKNRVAVLVGQADEDYQSRFIEGFLRRGFEEGFDVCIFSMYRKYQDAAEREAGESNIFTLVDPGDYDAIVILKDSIQIVGKVQEIEAKLHQEYQGEVLVIEQDSEFFPTVCTDGYEGMRQVVEHMIEVHGYHDIAYLGGKKKHKHSIERHRAYKDVMEEHGLDVSEDNVVYGDFWYTSGELCVNQLLSRRGQLPEAIVTANDCMAIGLCQALIRRGFRVPEDVAVAGYDGTEEGRTSPVPITSAQIPAESCGEYSAEYIAAKLRGSGIDPYRSKANLIVGKSCGCSECSGYMRDMRRKEWETTISEEGFYSVNTTIAEDLMLQNDLLGYLSVVYSYAYQIPEAESFHLCLNDTWKNLSSDPNVRFAVKGYTKEMLHAIRYYREGSGGKVSVSDTFPAKDLLPELKEKTEEPRAFLFLPVYFESESFGYAVVSYGQNPRSYDETFRIWIKLINRCLESLRRAALLQLLRERTGDERVWDAISSAEPVDSNLTIEEQKDLDLVRRILDENLLTYHFQPIVRATDGEIYSYEALMRSTTEQKVSPLKIIKYAGMLNRLADVESATFLNVLGLVDEKKAELEGRKVFINSIPGVKMRNADMAKSEALMSAHHETVVVELTEEAELAEAQLESMKQRLRALGIEIAVDDYGTGYSNVSNLLRYMPNYVKIDRSLLSEIQYRQQKQHFVREIIEFCHENNILALAEGVETSEELRTVIHLGADLIQGFYTAKPAGEITQQIDDRIRKEIRDYAEERQDGLAKRIYVAGKTNRVLLSNLMKYGNTDIVVPAENAVYKDISIIGTPGMETDIHMRVESGYQGRIVLENVVFSNVKKRPCIELGEGADVILTLVGENVLKNGGIQVPPDASLTVEGAGNLTIRMDFQGYYGIGNNLESGHGLLQFLQDGEIKILTGGKKGVCIGAGLGGEVWIRKGKYYLESRGDLCVGIGAFEGPVKVVLSECDMDAELSMTRGVGIGSLTGDAEISVAKSAIRFFTGGSENVGVGTLDGSRAKVEIREANVTLNMRGEQSTCIGALRGATDFRLEFAGMQLENGGVKALGIGGYTEDTSIYFGNADTKLKLTNELGIDSYVKEDRIRIVNGRSRFLVNGKEIQREVEEGYEEAK